MKSLNETKIESFSALTVHPFINFQPTLESEVVTHSLTKIFDSGWTVVTGLKDLDAAEKFLANFGELMHQYDGELRYDVKAKPEFEKFQYSQSSNTITPHTEAPVYGPPPRYLALYCHHQAKCGGGYTDFADGYRFVDSLDENYKQQIATKHVDFTGSRLPSEKRDLSVRTPILSLSPSGKPILRFSYNVFFYDDLHPVIESEGGKEADHGNQLLKDLAQLGLDFFKRQQTKILTPENSILIWDNHRMIHARSKYEDKSRHLTRYWIR